jgi:hypothetical protein
MSFSTLDKLASFLSTPKEIARLRTVVILLIPMVLLAPVFFPDPNLRDAIQNVLDLLPYALYITLYVVSLGVGALIISLVAGFVWTLVLLGFGLLMFVIKGKQSTFSDDILSDIRYTILTIMVCTSKRVSELIPFRWSLIKEGLAWYGIMVTASVTVQKVFPYFWPTYPLTSMLFIPSWAKWGGVIIFIVSIFIYPKTRPLKQSTLK